jgi:hypothetical protein
VQLKEFLSRVLPGEGYKCWVEITKRKKVIQGFTTSTEELALKLADIDARGSDAYFACSSYKTMENRTAANVHLAKAFWLDIDAGEGKPYANADDAIQACDDFCDRFDLPLPLAVRSGGGAHVYWLLDRPLAPEIWQAAASRFKLLISASGFRADPARTADSASILRPIDTHNFKIPGSPRPVELNGEDGGESIEATFFLEALLAKSPPASAKATENAIKSPCVDPSTNINVSLLAGVSKAFDASKGVEAGRRGSTQLKYAGELVARGLPEEEVIEKCRVWNELCTPPQEDKEVVRIVRSAITMHARRHPPVLPPEEAYALPKLPYGYRWGQQNQLEVEVEELDASGAPIPKWKIVSRYPVYLLAILKNEHGERENSYLFQQYNPLTGWHEFAISSDGMNSQNWYAAWFKNGGTIQAGMDKHFKTYVRRTEDMLRDMNAVPRHNQFGWKGDDAFLVGDVLLKKGQPYKAYGTDKLTPLMRTMALPKEGSLEEWTAAADKFFAPGMEAHGFALLTSFAAPLIKFCAGLGDGGSVLSLVSEDSGRGKTPAAEAIASVWGDLDSTVVTGNFTENRRIESIVRHCNLPQVQEEMTMADPVVAAESIKKFTTGCDRGRLDRTGAASGVPERYQTILISVANLSLYDMVAQVDRAASRRIFELEMKRPDNEAFSNLGGITREMMRCRGFAGRRWAQILTMDNIPKYLQEHLTGLTQEKPGSAIMRYRHLIKSEAEHRFIVWLLAVVDVAARLLVHYGVLHFDVERIMEWAVNQAVYHTGDKEIDDSPAKLQRFLGEYINACLIVSDAFDSKQGPVIPHVEPRNGLLMRAEMRTKRLYISQDVLKKWCIRHRVPFIVFGRALSEAGIVLERSKSVTLGAGTMYPSARTYCWEVDLSHPAMSGMLKEVKATAEVKTA